MAESERNESEIAANPARASGSTGRNGATATQRVSLRQVALRSKAKATSRRTLRETWSDLWETDPPASPVRLGPGDEWPKVQRFAPALLTSLLVHSSVLFFLCSVPFGVVFYRLMGAHPKRFSNHPRMIVYEFRHLSLPDYLPVINPLGKGAPPGKAAKHGAHSRLGSSHFDPRITIVSSPPHPDNSRVTIKTEEASTKPPIDIKVPDLISEGSTAVPEKAQSSSPNELRSDNPSPQVEGQSPAQPPKPLETQNMSPLPKPGATPPLPPPPLELASRLPDIPSPRLEVPPPQPVKNPTQPDTSAEPIHRTPASPTRESPHPPVDSPRALSKTGPGAGPATDSHPRPQSPKVTTLSVDPIPLKDVAALPAGTRAGAFSISPSGAAGAHHGVPLQGGEPGALADAGKGGHGSGGDQSVAAGNGARDTGSGGHGIPGSSASPTLSVSGRAGAPGISTGTLAPLKAEELVYSVNPATVKTRAPSVVVSSGSGGGGGLPIYGVLHGEKIYTVYFPMPGKNWILQYCAHQDKPQVDPASRVVRIQFGPPVTPPAAIEQFEFHRPELPANSAKTMIILHGVIHADGSVGDLAVVQGLDPTSNDAARSAFSRWKFKPALRAGVPVELEILVGIP
jgi:hypothetical protein